MTLPTPQPEATQAEEPRHGPPVGALSTEQLRILVRPRLVVYLGAAKGELYPRRVGEACEVISIRRGVAYPLTVKFSDGTRGIAHAGLVRAQG